MHRSRARAASETAPSIREPRAWVGTPAARLPPDRLDPAQPPTHLRSRATRFSSRVTDRERVQAIARELFPVPAASTRHANLDVHGAGVVAEPEIRAQVVL